VAEVEAHLATLASRRVAITDEQRQRFQHRGDALAAVGQHPTAPGELNKRMVRPVLHELIIDTTQEPPEHRSMLHWQGGVPTALRVPRTRGGQHRYVTAPEVLELLRARSKVGQEQTSAATRNRLGSRTATGKTWRAHRGASMRSTPCLPHGAQGHAWLTLEHAAPPLGVSATVLRRLLRHGTLPARQGVPWAPWILHASARARLAVQTEGQAVQGGRRHPGLRPGQPAFPGQAAPPAGDAPAVASPAETRSLSLRSGAP